MCKDTYPKLMQEINRLKDEVAAMENVVKAVKILKLEGNNIPLAAYVDTATFMEAWEELDTTLAKLEDKKTKDSCPCGCLSGGIEDGEIVKQPCLLEGEE